MATSASPSICASIRAGACRRSSSTTRSSLKTLAFSRTSAAAIRRRDWPKKTWDQAKLMSTLAWLSNSVHPSFAQSFRQGRYVDGDAAQEAVKTKGRANFQAYLQEIDKLLEGHKW